MIRAALLWFHRYVALVASIVLLVVALSGAAIVFEGAIDRALNPALHHVAPAGTVVSLDTLVARATQAAGGAPVSGLSIALARGRSASAVAGNRTVFLNPHTGGVLGTRTAGERDATLARWLHLLHVRLLGSPAGAAVVGAVTVVALLLVLTGLVLWWRERLWRIQWTASWKRVAFDLHHGLGVLASFVLVVITASGIVIHYDAIGRAIGGLDRTPPAPPVRQAAADARAATISWDSVAAIARRALPGATLIFLSQPPSPETPLSASMRFPEDRTPGGRSRVTIDRFQGTVLQIENTRAAGLGTRLNNLKRSLHTGDVLGKPTEAVWMMAALVLASQAVTGVLMWWNGRPARTAERARRQGGTE